MENKEDSNNPNLDKALGQIAIETARDSRVFLGKIFGTAATEFGGMLGDQMRHWRFKNLNRILSESAKITYARGYEIETLQELPFGDAFRTVEAASFEEEETVQTLWARLIANAVDPASNITIKKVYIDLLKSMSSAEAAFLELLWACEKRNYFKSHEEISAFNQNMNELAEYQWRKFELDDRRAAIQNLVRIRCVVFRPQPIDMTRLFAKLPNNVQRPFDQWSLVDPEKFQDVINKIGEFVFLAAGIKEYQNTSQIPVQSAFSGFAGFGKKIDVPEMNFMLTALGTDLVRACEKDGSGLNQGN